jgi:hypothetical protein
MWFRNTKSLPLVVTSCLCIHVNYSKEPALLVKPSSLERTALLSQVTAVTVYPGRGRQ